MFFSAATDHPIRRTLSIARTSDLNGSWIPDPEPILPAPSRWRTPRCISQAANQTWFLFTNHVGIDGFEYTDAVVGLLEQGPEPLESGRQAPSSWIAATARGRSI